MIATTDNDNEALIAINTGAVVDTAGGVRVSVPNAAEARHAYVIVKTGNTFAVWVDGVKRGSFTVPTEFALGGTTTGKLHSGIQVTPMSARSAERRRITVAVPSNLAG